VIGRRPLVLIEGLDRRRILSQRLAQTKREDNLAVGQVAGNLRRAPFAGSRRNSGSLRAEDVNHVAKRPGVAARIASSGRPSRKQS